MVMTRAWREGLYILNTSLQEALEGDYIPSIGDDVDAGASVKAGLRRIRRPFLAHSVKTHKVSAI